MQDHFGQVPRAELPVSGTLTIDCYSDLHVGSFLCDTDLLEKHLKATAADPSRYLVLNGDLFNSEVKSAKHGGVYQDKLNLDESLDYLEKLLLPLAPKILAITGGNHDARAFNSAGIDPVKQLAARLRVGDRYMRAGGYLATRHGEATGSRDRFGKPRPIEYAGFIHHGTGISATLAAMRLAALVHKADYHTFGHTHQIVDFPLEWWELYPQTQTVVRRTATVGVSGSYLRYGGYVAEQAMRPTRLGHISYHLRDGEKRVDISWS